MTAKSNQDHSVISAAQQPYLLPIDVVTIESDNLVAVRLDGLELGNVLTRCQISVWQQFFKMAGRCRELARNGIDA